MTYQRPTLGDIQRRFPDHRVNSGGGINIVCPAHTSTSSPPQRKLWVTVDPESGHLRFLCRTRDCGHWAVWDALGLERPPRKTPHTCGPYCADYIRQDGEPIRRHREDHEPGSCQDERCTGKHVWGPKGAGARGVDFRFWYETSDPVDPIVICEGEKAAHSIMKAGMTGASWWGGTNTTHLVSYDALKGHTLIIWPDNDGPGRKAANDVAQRALTAGAISAKVVPQDPPGEDGRDAADYEVMERAALVALATDWTPPASESRSPPRFKLGGWHHPGDRNEDWECTYLATARYTLRFNDHELIAAQHFDNSWSVGVDGGRGVWAKNRGAAHDGITRALSAWFFDCCKAANGDGDGQVKEGTLKAVLSWKNKLRNATLQDKVLDSVSEAITSWQKDGILPRGLTVCREQDLDAPGNFIGTPSGVVDLTTGRLLPPEEGRTKMITMTIADPYDPTATDPAVTQLFDHLNQDELTWLLQGLGFALRRNPSRRVYLLQGNSGGGKTTLLNHLSNALGDYMTAIPTGILEAGLQDSGGNPAMEAVTRPAIAFRSEPPPKIDVPFIKSVAGADQLEYRMLYSNTPIRRTCTATIVISCNVGQEPKWPLSTDDGLSERVRVLRYPSVPESRRDPRLPEKLNTRRARQAMVALLVSAGMHLDRPPADIPQVRDASEALSEKSQSQAEVWLRSVLRPDPGAELLASYFWQEALDAAGEKPDSNRVWGIYRNKLSELAHSFGLMPTKSSTPVGPRANRVRVFKGVRMVPPGAAECQLCGQEYADGEGDPAFDDAYRSCQDVEACNRIQETKRERTAMQGELAGS